MRDWQYIISLACFGVSVVLVLAGIVSMPLWLGWAGALPPAIICGGLVTYFYWGPRPDLRPKGSRDGTNRHRHA